MIQHRRDYPGTARSGKVPFFPQSISVSVVLMLLTMCAVSSSMPAIELVDASGLAANSKQNRNVNAAN